MKNLLQLFRVFIYFSLFASLVSCAPNKRKIEMYDSLRMQKIEYRDSLFITYTVKQWHDSNGIQGVSGFNNYSRLYKMSDEQIQYSFGGMFYSPNKEKIIAWVVEKLPNAATKEIYNQKSPEVNKLCPEGNDTIYDIEAVVGFRNDINKGYYIFECTN